MPTETAKKANPASPAEQLADLKKRVPDIDHAGAGASAHDAAQSQSEKFMQAARDLECDDDPERFADRVRKLVRPSAEAQPSKGVTPTRAKE